MGTVVGTCMPDIELEQPHGQTTFAPMRRRRYGKYKDYWVFYLEKKILFF